MMVNTTNVVKRYFRSNVRSTFKEIFGYQNQKHLNFCIVFGIIIYLPLFKMVAITIVLSF